jgi:2',3'-cyclic-nucleotide 2'-phosphodiesterase (5'-nucleotidase family)
MRRFWPTTTLALALAASVGVAACQGCGASTTKTTTESSAVKPTPTVRLYVLSTVAGALEPCGCAKDQLGGVDHFSAFVSAQKALAPASLVVGAGPLLFMDPTLSADRATQNEWNAFAIARAAQRFDLRAWAPGANDWAAGAAALKGHALASGATLLAGNLEGLAGTQMIDVGGIKVGLVGVSEPRDRAGNYPEGVVSIRTPTEAMHEGIAQLEAGGARVLIGLAALPRGEALRLADTTPQLHVLAVGKAVETGEANDAPSAPVLVGSTLVVEASNHLQTIAMVDLFVRDGGSGPLVFADAGGIAKQDELLSVAERIRALEARINSWEQDKTIRPADLAARKAELARLQTEKAKLEATAAPSEGSFFLYQSVEVRAELGSDPEAKKAMNEYYRRVNDHNKVALADRRPPPVAPGQASYVGVEACTPCHSAARKVWDGTRHAHAYATLQKDFKEYNLDCVSCHVTGYGKPGGSTVTWNAKLQNVGCEECHGPGSLHAEEPTKAGLIIASPSLSTCASNCHHPPHVDGFDAAEKVKHILGPGHGM